jgi:hypothetical protein
MLAKLLTPVLLLAARAAGSKINWGPCEPGEFNTTLKVECGKLRVPLDYTQPNNNKTLELEIVRLAAAAQPSRGSIQLNFGGPGFPTRSQLVAIGPLLQL